jgi:hypothetical protein
MLNVSICKAIIATGLQPRMVLPQKVCVFVNLLTAMANGYCPSRGLWWQHQPVRYEGRTPSQRRYGNNACQGSSVFPPKTCTR